MEKQLENVQYPGLYAYLTRLFGWSMLGVMVSWLINNVLTISFGWPGVTSVINVSSYETRLFIQLTIVAISIAIPAFYVSNSKTRLLREDATIISEFNIFLIRAAFFSVLYVGLVDALISFLRVEEYLSILVGEQLESKLSRSAFRGTYIHIPVIVSGVVTAIFVRTLGFHWLSILIVLAELLIVLTRFIFSYEQAFMGDLVRFWYAALFLFASAYTLLQDEHVRIDVLYAAFTQKTRGIYNTIGSILFGMTLCWTILYYGLGKKSSIIYSPIAHFEISQSSYGLYIKYLMAGFLAVFAITMLIQFVAYLLLSVADWKGEVESTSSDNTNIN